MDNKGISKKQFITGWVFSALAILFLLFDGAGKLAKPDPVLQATLQLGYPETSITTIGILAIICTILYIVPRTSFIGAVLLTGFFGGAVAAQFRSGNPLFSNVLFPVYLGIFVWIGLYLRNPQLRKLVAGKAG